MMEEDKVTTKVDPRLVERIVSSYVQHHKVGVDQLAELIAEVHRTLARVAQDVHPGEAGVPAVSIRRSVQRDYVICLDCGHRGLTLSRHIRLSHGLTPAAYRDHWKLSTDHPLTAPSYSARRSALAKQLGLGRKPREADVTPTAPAPATPSGGAKRRGRPPKQPSATA
jgi:predicted transcriptional regulator